MFFGGGKGAACFEDSLEALLACDDVQLVANRLSTEEHAQGKLCWGLAASGIRVPICAVQEISLFPGLELEPRQAKYKGFPWCLFHLQRFRMRQPLHLGFTVSHSQGGRRWRS